MRESTDPIQMLEVLTDIAHEAGRLVMAARDVAPTKKGEIDLVTEFDVAAERLITERLRAAYPGIPVMGEELAGDVEAGERHARLFIIDPIDGTTNFANGHPFFGISLAYAERAADARLIPKVGVVGAPGLGRLYAAAEGHGATRNGEAIRVSATARLGDALCATGFPYDRWHSDDDNVTEFRAFLKKVRGIRRCGAASLDLCLVADGTYDFYWERKLKPWDLAAGAAIVREAGGRLSDERGGPSDVTHGALVASNGALHAAVIDVLRPLRASRASAEGADPRGE